MVKKKIVIAEIIILLFSCLVSTKCIYGEFFLRGWSIHGQKYNAKLDDFELQNIERTDQIFKILDSNAKIQFKIPKDTRIINFHITQIRGAKSVDLVMYMPNQKGKYSENRKIVHPLKDGNNIFVLPKESMGVARLDLGESAGIEFKLEHTQIYKKVVVIPDFIYFFVFLIVTCNVFFGLFLKWEKIKEKINENRRLAIITLSFFCLFLLWSLIIPYNQGPDERMRYEVARYIYTYDTLPRGDDPVLVSSNDWGVSYAYSPYLAYLIAAFFMKIGSVCGASSIEVLHWARCVSVFSSTITMFFCYKIAEQLNFRKKYLLPCIVGFIPQFTFISAYVNCDSLAIMSTAIIVYAWILGAKSSWNEKACIYFVIGMAICLASYYNCYGFLLTSFIYFICYYFYYYYKTKNKNYMRAMLKKGIVIAVGVLAISGWWFIRNYILYDGDILGSSFSRATAIKYASPELSPLNKLSLHEQGVSLLDMLFDKKWKWVSITLQSFFAKFGYMTVVLNENIYTAYFVLFGALILFGLVKTKKEKIIIPRLLLHSNIAIVIVLSLIYSYTSDFQPQGRYILPIIIPGMILISKNIEILSIMIKKNIECVVCLLLFILNYYALGMVIVPFYFWS